MRLSDTQWRQIEPIFGSTKASSQGGRPRQDNRQVLEGILWVVCRGAQWNELPPSYGSGTTCWRRYTEWVKTEIWKEMWLKLIPLMSERQLAEWTIALTKGRFIVMKK